MELPIIKFKIEQSVLDLNIDEDKIAKAIEDLSNIRDKDVSAYISGRPLHIYNDTSDMHMDNCEVQLQKFVKVGRVFLNRIPKVGHSDIPIDYISDDGYPAMQCLDRRGNEIIMGMRSILGFEIEFLST